MTDHGPGLTWLAERAGREPNALLQDRAALLSALADAGRDVAALAVRLDSEDQPTRTRAQAEARAVRARFAAGSTTTPAERLVRRVTAALREETARLRADGAQPTVGRTEPRR